MLKLVSIAWIQVSENMEQVKIAQNEFQNRIYSGVKLWFPDLLISE